MSTKNKFASGGGSGLPAALLVGLGVILPAAAAKLTRSAMGRGYKVVTREDPPYNPAAPEIAWKDALAWTILTGVTGALARLAVRRLLAKTSVPAKGDDMEEARASLS